MKLAEALILRSDLQKRIEEIKVRLVRSAKIQEGKKPNENPEELLKELDKCISELTLLVQRINKTNAAVKVDGDETIADLLTKKETVILKRSVLNALLEEAAVKHNRYSNSEVKIHSTVNIAVIQKQIDDLSAEYRIIDTKIQEKNWLTELE